MASGIQLNSTNNSEMNIVYQGTSGATRTVVVPDNNMTVAGIVDSGTNANGTYIKYEDGTLICYGIFTYLSTSTANQTVSFPSTFIDTNYVVNVQARGIASGAAGSSYVAESSFNNTTSFYSKLLLHNASTISQPANTTCGFYAIGRWK